MWNRLIVTYLRATFNGHMPCGSRDIECLIFHVTLKDHVIIGPCDFMEESSSSYIPTPTMFRSHIHCDIRLLRDIARPRNHIVM